MNKRSLPESFLVAAVESAVEGDGCPLCLRIFVAPSLGHPSKALTYTIIQQPIKELFFRSSESVFVRQQAFLLNECTYL